MKLSFGLFSARVEKDLGGDDFDDDDAGNPDRDPDDRMKVRLASYELEEQMREADTGPVVRPPRAAPAQSRAEQLPASDKRRIRRGWQTPNW